MNAPVSAASFQQLDRQSAERWAKEWRSDCIDCFAKVEMAVGDLLLSLKNSGLGLAGVKLGQPIGPSFRTLRKVLKSKGHWKRERALFDADLDSLQQLLEQRSHLTHGELTLWEGGEQQWLITLKHCESNCCGPRNWNALSIEDAKKLLIELQSQARQFREKAAQLITHFPKA